MWKRRWQIWAKPRSSYKLDGARIQVHKSGDDIRVFTRNLRDVSGSVPEVIEVSCCPSGP